MWIFSPIGLIFYLIIGWISGTREAQQAWEEAKALVEGELYDSQREIDSLLENKQGRYNYQVLVNSYESSLHTQNLADQIYVESLDILNDVDKILNKIKQEKVQLETGSNRSNREVSKKLRMIDDMVGDLSVERSKLFQQKEALFEKVQQAKSKTRSVALCIRDNCGDQGRRWYMQIEAG